MTDLPFILPLWFEILTTVSTKVTTVWNTTPCIWINVQRSKILPDCMVSHSRRSHYSLIYYNFQIYSLRIRSSLFNSVGVYLSEHFSIYCMRMLSSYDFPSCHIFPDLNSLLSQPYLQLSHDKMASNSQSRTSPSTTRRGKQTTATKRAFRKRATDQTCPEHWL